MPKLTHTRGRVLTGETNSKWVSMVEKAIQDSITTSHGLLENLVPTSTYLANIVLETFEKNGKLIFVGNGGSAAEAEHISAEFVGRFIRHRKGLPCISLTSSGSLLTAVGNDFGFEQVFARQIEALMGPSDLLVALSTSGQSENVLQAVKLAREKSAMTIGFTGNGKGPLTKLVNFSVEIPSSDVQRVQEAHLFIWHVVCDLVDQSLSAPSVSEPG